MDTVAVAVVAVGGVAIGVVAVGVDIIHIRRAVINGWNIYQIINHRNSNLGLVLALVLTCIYGIYCIYIMMCIF